MSAPQTPHSLALERFGKFFDELAKYRVLRIQEANCYSFYRAYKRGNEHFERALGEWEEALHKASKQFQVVQQARRSLDQYMAEQINILGNREIGRGLAELREAKAGKT